MQKSSKELDKKECRNCIKELYKNGGIKLAKIKARKHAKKVARKQENVCEKVAINQAREEAGKVEKN